MLPVEFPGIDHITQKDRPTFLLRQDDFLLKMDPDAVSDTGKMTRLISNKNITTVRELGEAIAHGNRELYDLTVLYCAKSAKKDELEEFSC